MSQETGFEHTNKRRLLSHTHTHSLRPLRSPNLVGQHVHEADRKHAASRRVALDFALHPVLVVGALVQHHQHLALLELQLVVVVRIAVVQGPTAPVSASLRNRKCGQKPTLISRAYPNDSRADRLT